MPRAPAASSDSRRSEPDGALRREDVRCHSGSPSIAREALRSAAGAVPRWARARASPHEAENP